LGLRRFHKKVSQELENIDILHCHDADTLALHKALPQTPILFDMHDLQHTWVRYPAPNSLFRKFISKRMKNQMLKNAKRANAIITSSGGFSDWLLRHGLESSVVENRPQSRIKYPKPENFTIGYFGRIREVQSFELLIEALQLIPLSDRPSLFIAGDGVRAEDVKQLLSKHPEVTSEIGGSFKHEELPQMMKKISMMFAMYRPDRGNIDDGALPSKMFEAAAYGRPSIVNKGAPMGELCVNEELGVAVDWGNSQQLAEAILSLEGYSTYLAVDEIREKKRFLEVFESIKI
jgi:glycosyltransferase involved in cell wall biosynthesis